MTRFYLAFIFVFISIPILSYWLSGFKKTSKEYEQESLQKKIEEIGKREDEAC